LDLDLNSILKKAKDHKMTITYIPMDEGTLRETSGILRNVTDDTIHLQIGNDFGEKVDFYLNRRACVLLSLMIEGKEVESKDQN